MYMRNVLQAASIGLILAASGAADAASGTPQTHHCKMSDGSTDTTKTHKQCTAAKGIWTKDAAAAAPAAAPAAPATAAPAPK